MTDRQLIEFGAQELAARYGFGDLKDMRQRDLGYLCERIEERSGILISLSTIKRILNGQYNRLPQVATLNAIALCLGYADWQGFKTRKLAEAVVSIEREMTGQVRSKKAVKIIGAGSALLLLAAILSWSYFSRSPANGDRTATFTIRKTTQNAVPNTVVFSYDIDRVSGDSFFIQQSWDKNRRVRIYKNSYTLTDIYYEPGYHVAKLYANERILKTIDVSIPTDRWFFYCKESLTRGLPAYIQTDRPIRHGILGLNRQALVDNKIDPQKSQVYLATFFPTTIGADADNFRLTARLKLTEVRNTACPFIMTEVYCQRRFTYCMFTVPGCTGGISAQFGDQVVDGKDNDLSALAFDVHLWHDLEMLVRHRQVTVSIDGKAVLTKEYTTSSGLITGLGFHSNGLCEVDSIRLESLDGETVYPQ
jgi:transcriptional regulator with XRE-family HTH domain